MVNSKAVVQSLLRGLALLGLTVFLGCAPETHAEPRRTARSAVAQGAPLIDVRTPQEFATRHLPGAINIPVDEVARRIGEVSSRIGPHDKTVVLYCRSGARSASAARVLRANGFEVIDIGPMTAW